MFYALKVVSYSSSCSGRRKQHLQEIQFSLGIEEVDGFISQHIV
jgi:hypothetical protein